eukprot:TRINITY_DN20200_c0_g1_i1.p1 TRINITY_DN20200_c0_g1~~TRINITY_DN20200_c0_g1_i1.p1  ORF type:complete len:569 (+),score=121.87 TRINITY_DN20200_c0_g1_i1:196-1902(+)
MSMDVPPPLWRQHCDTPHCGECTGPCAGAQNPLFSHTETTQLLVGGGISSIEAAKIALEDEGAQVVIVERDCFLGGIWVTAANPESRIQVDPVAFRPIEDNTIVSPADPEDPFSTIYPNRADVLGRLAMDVERLELRRRTVFGVEVVRFELLDSGLVRVYMRKPKKVQDPHPSPNEPDECACCAAADDGEFSYDFQQIHIRTGSLTKRSHNSSLSFCGENSFSGRIVAGIANDIPVQEFEGLDVLIVGFGAFGVENARRALQGRAKSVTILSRKFDKLLFPELATYMLRSRLQQDDADSQEKVTKLWADVHRVVATAAEATGMSEVVMNESVVKTIQGSEHFVFSKGLPSVASNTVLLGCYYGLIEVLQDEIDLFDGPIVRTKKGAELRADVVVKCLGFGCDQSLLEGHVVKDSYFIDGEATMTHNLRADCVNGQHLIGPHVECSNFLISYYEDAQEYERCIQRLNREPAVYQAFKSFKPANNYAMISAVDYFTTLALSEKLATFGDPGIDEIFERNRINRRSLYDKCLPEEAFLAHDRANWLKLAGYFASLAGKPVLPYPFDFVSST